MMYGDPPLWHDLMGRLVDITVTFLRVQLDAGAQAVQLFDSWAGMLSRRDYETFVAPHSSRVFAEISDFDVPRIHFGVGTGELLAPMARVGADVVGVDWRVPLDEAQRRIGPGPALQGNLDPTVLFAGDAVIAEHVARVVADADRAVVAGRADTSSTSATASFLTRIPTPLTRVVDLDRRDPGWDHRSRSLRPGRSPCAAGAGSPRRGYRGVRFGGSSRGLLHDATVADRRTDVGAGVRAASARGARSRRRTRPVRRPGGATGPGRRCGQVTASTRCRPRPGWGFRHYRRRCMVWPTTPISPG